MENQWIREESENKGRVAGFLALGRFLLLITVVWVWYSLWALNAYAAEDNHIRHEHIGVESEAGGCYTIPVLCEGKIERFNAKVKCSVMFKNRPWVNTANSSVVFDCWNCGVYEMHYNSDYYRDFYMSFQNCSNTIEVTRYRCSACGKEYPEMREKCDVVCGYATECGMEQNQVIGTLDIKPETTNWTRQCVLRAQVGDAGFDLGSVEPVWDDGSTGWTMVASENRVYSVRMSAGSGYSGASCSINIGNIDRDEPVIGNVGMQPEQSGRAVRVSVEARDNTSGIADKGYSWDAGSTWTEENNRSYNQNGNYSVWVRDKAGNVSRREFSVTTIVDIPANGGGGMQNQSDRQQSNVLNQGGTANQGGTESQGGAESQSGATEQQGASDRTDTLSQTGASNLTDGANQSNGATDDNGKSREGSRTATGKRDAKKEKNDNLTDADTAEQNEADGEEIEISEDAEGESMIDADSEYGISDIDAEIIMDSEGGITFDTADWEDEAEMMGIELDYPERNNAEDRDGNRTRILSFLVIVGLCAGGVLALLCLIRKKTDGKIKHCLLHKR